jgi:hypothetical protein
MSIPEAQQQLVRAMQAGDREAVRRLEARMQAVPGWRQACEQSLAVWQALAQWQHQRLQALEAAPLQAALARACQAGLDEGYALGFATALRLLGQPGEN